MGNTQMSKARVGIVTSCYNEERFIEACIDSIDKQTYSKWYHIIVDDGSNDQTAQIAEKRAHQSKHRRLVRQPNAGPGPAKNRGIELLPDSICYVICLDADDYLHPSALEVAVSYLDSHSTVGLLYWKYQLVDEIGSSVPGNHRKHSWQRRRVPTTFGIRALPDGEPKTPIHAVFTHCGIISSCSMLRASVLEQTSGYNEDPVFQVGMQDVHLFIEMALKKEVHFLPTPLTYYRVHKDQISADKERAHKQGKRLHKYWQKEVKNMSPHERTQLEEAIYYAELRYPFWRRLKSAFYILRHGDWLTSTRVVMGALWRYLWSLLPPRIGYQPYVRYRDSHK